MFRGIVLLFIGYFTAIFTSFTIYTPYQASVQIISICLKHFEAVAAIWVFNILV